MGNDYTAIIIAGATAVSAIFAPLLTALINNHHMEKMKKSEMFTNRKIDAIENYIRYTGAIISSDTADNQSNYGKWRGIVVLYCGEKIAEKINYLDGCVSVASKQTAVKEFIEVCKMLNNELPKA